MVVDVSNFQVCWIFNAWNTCHFKANATTVMYFCHPQFHDPIYIKSKHGCNYLFYYNNYIHLSRQYQQLNAVESLSLNPDKFELVHCFTPRLLHHTQILYTFYCILKSALTLLTCWLPSLLIPKTWKLLKISRNFSTLLKTP